MPSHPPKSSQKQRKQSVQMKVRNKCAQNKEAAPAALSKKEASTAKLTKRIALANEHPAKKKRATRAQNVDTQTYEEAPKIDPANSTPQIPEDAFYYSRDRQKAAKRQAALQARSKRMHARKEIRRRAHIMPTSRAMAPPDKQRLEKGNVPRDSRSAHIQAVKHRTFCRRLKRPFKRLRNKKHDRDEIYESSEEELSLQMSDSQRLKRRKTDTLLSSSDSSVGNSSTGTADDAKPFRSKRSEAQRARRKREREQNFVNPNIAIAQRLRRRNEKELASCASNTAQTSSASRCQDQMLHHHEHLRTCRQSTSDNSVGKLPGTSFAPVAQANSLLDDQSDVSGVFSHEQDVSDASLPDAFSANDSMLQQQNPTSSEQLSAASGDGIAHADLSLQSQSDISGVFSDEQSTSEASVAGAISTLQQFPANSSDSINSANTLHDNSSAVSTQSLATSGNGSNNNDSTTLSENQFDTLTDDGSSRRKRQKTNHNTASGSNTRRKCKKAKKRGRRTSASAASTSSEARRIRQREYQRERRRRIRAANAVPNGLSVKEFPRIRERLENDPEEYFKDSGTNVNKAQLLYYLNSGYAICDQYKEYDANCAAHAIDKAKIIREIRDEKLSDSELHNKLKAFFTQHSYTDAKLMSCGCCGIRRREREHSPEIKYQRLYLKDEASDVLRYDKDELEELQLQKNMRPVTIPTDADFTPRTVRSWKIRSVYKSKQRLGTFHLHPELVEIDEQSGDESTMVCPACWKDIDRQKTPEFSIAAGLDFGYHKRLGLEPPNLDEQMILARCRIIIATLKLKSNSYGKVGFHRDKLLCHAILFAHNSATQAASLLSTKEMFDVSKLKDMLKLYFLDPYGNIDKLFHAAMQRTDIFARPWVICQWLEILHREHSHYGDIVVPDIDYVKLHVEAANKAIQDGASHVTGEAEFAAETQIGSDVAQTQTSEVLVPDGVALEHNVDASDTACAGDESMRYSYVLQNPEAHLENETIQKFRSLHAISKIALDKEAREQPIIPELDPLEPASTDDGELSQGASKSTTSSNKNSTNTKSSAVVSLGNSDGTDSIDSNPACANEEDDDTTSDDDTAETDWSNCPVPDDIDDMDNLDRHGARRWPDAVNEFVATEMVLTTAFPHVFTLGKAYGRAAGKMTHDMLRHLLHQFHMVPSKDRRLLAYLTDSKLRCGAVFGVQAYTRNNPKSLDVITNLINSKEEKQQLQYAISHPESDEADQVLRKYRPHFFFSGKDINYGAMEANKVKSFILETQKRMQAPFCFLTLNMEEVHNPRSIRACARTVDNKHFPAVFEEGCPYGDNGHEFMEYLKTVGETVGEGTIDFSASGRARMAMDDPIIFVEETKQMLNDVCSILLGIPPEDYYGALESSSRRKTRYFKCNKGVFGHCLAYVGVTEDHKKVGLELQPCHLLLYHTCILPSDTLSQLIFAGNASFSLPHIWRSFFLRNAAVCSHV